jgi:nucleoside-diphosphate-sugar epimerase
LLQRGFTVRCLVRSNRHTTSWLEGLPVEIARVDLLNLDSIKAALKDAEYVFHIAGVTKAKKRQEYFAGNVTATQNLLEASVGSRRLKKFCMVSSLTAVGPSPDGTPLIESSPSHPITTYGESKYAGEQACIAYRDRIPVVILRPPAIFGPRDKDILEIFRVAHWGISPSFGGKTKALSLLYAPDFAATMIDATLSEKTAGETYFVANPVVYKLPDIVRILSEIIGKKPIHVNFPSSLLYTAALVVEGISFFLPKPPILSIEKARDLLQQHWVCSSKKIEEHLGPQVHTPVEQALRATYQWYRDHRWL